jgi:hypothetical protein
MPSAQRILSNRYLINMPDEHSLRRNQLIAPFGVGAIHILRGGKAVVTAGLDYWFKDPNNPNAAAAPEQISAVQISDEPRLQARLHVSHFRLPPGPETVLCGCPQLRVPLFTFPTWYVCPACFVMVQRTLLEVGSPTCKGPRCESNNVPLRQVSFASACDYGHLQDFPWREWVHRDADPQCTDPMTYKAGGSGSLEDIVIRCACGKARNLQGIMSGEMPDAQSDNSDERSGSSILSSRLLEQPGVKGQKTPPFLCIGGRVWLGESRNNGACKPCDRPMRAVLINATNAHYSNIRSALWIPPSDGAGSSANVRRVLGQPSIRARVRLRKALNDTDNSIAEDLLKHYPDEFVGSTAQDLVKALSPMPEGAAAVEEGLTEEEHIRYPEFQQLKLARKSFTLDDHLEIRKWPENDVISLSRRMGGAIEGVSLVLKLRETRALAGFTRIVPDRVDGAPSPLVHMWKNQPQDFGERWLPAALVYGEGIFIWFNQERLAKWENQLGNLKKPFDALMSREALSARRMGRDVHQLSPRFLALHTLAHLAIRRLVFECGYGAASLRERLYISDNPKARMAGLLIYTASGDCEGSMGGLVAMGAAKRLESILVAAVEDASWCSSDPVCGDMGRSGGQGVDGLNGAACHCCALLPETSCELFNSYLDRELVCSLFGQSS